MMTTQSDHISISDQIETASRNKVRRSRNLLFLNLLVYSVISVLELIIGQADHSTALVADGQNNFTGIVSVASLIVGLSFSKRPRDTFHLEGHWQYENLAVFLSGLVMFLVGLSCIWTGATGTLGLLNGHYAAPIKGQAAVMAAVSGVTMLCLSVLNHFVGRRTHSGSLAASARDFLSDALTSAGTMLAILGAALLNVHWIDPVAAVLLGFFILYNGSRILSDSAEKLSNGFSPVIRAELSQVIASTPGVSGVSFVDGRYSGDNIIVEAEVVVSDHMNIKQAYQICQRITDHLQQQFPVLYCCIQVKPACTNTLFYDHPSPRRDHG